jgi:23S rRNA (cytosine1962-C5)-methyltransferase
MQLLTPQYWKDYELIDSGDFEKLERFGKYILIRPEPQAVWDKKLGSREWERLSHVKFEAKSSSSGNWKKYKDMPDRWQINYAHEGMNLAFQLALTSFKHVGVFPEQSVNWEYIYESVKMMKTNQPKVLNLFAYTGGASLAAKSATADVIHLDSIKQVVSWAKQNMELSGLKDIRWVVEDALTFVKREVKRGKKYNGIILDPPAYGHGPNGENWKLEDHINEMMKNVVQLLEPNEHFLILNTYSLGFSSLIIENLLGNFVDKNVELNTGELYLQATKGGKLPLGVFGKYRKISV